MTKKIPDTYGDLIKATADKDPSVGVTSHYDVDHVRWWVIPEDGNGFLRSDNDMLEHLLTRRIWKRFRVFVPGHLLVFKIFKDAALSNGPKSKRQR